MRSWIVLWQESGDAVQAISAAACKEAEYEKAGRFNGKCMATFTSIFNGLSIQVCSAGHQPLHPTAYCSGSACALSCMPSMTFASLLKVPMLGNSHGWNALLGALPQSLSCGHPYNCSQQYHITNILRRPPQSQCYPAVIMQCAAKLAICDRISVMCS